jgi:cytochrome c553
MKWKFAALMVLVVVFTFQCSHYDELQKNGRESSASGGSHNVGQDCMSCHNQHGNEAITEGGWWNIAGSVFSDDGDAPFSNAKIELWSKPDREGTLYYTLEVDQNGNFYTEKIVKYNGSCFPVVVNLETGDYESMSSAYRSGGCNSCHGVSTDRIYVE